MKFFVLIHLIFFQFSHAKICQTNTFHAPIAQPSLLTLHDDYIKFEGELIYKGEINRSKRSKEVDAYERDRNNIFFDITSFSIYQTQKTNPFIFDLYFKTNIKVNIVIKDFDFRVLFHKKILNTGNNYFNCLKYLQAHFAEYERKTVVVSHLKRNENDHYELFSKIIASQAKKNLQVSHFAITNNCRGRGNFEFEIPNLVKGYFTIPPNLLEKMYKEYDEVRPSCESDETIFYSLELDQTEIRFPKDANTQIRDLKYSKTFKDFFVSLYSEYNDPLYQWYKLGSLDDALPSWCNKKLLEINSKNQKIDFDIKRDFSKIPFNQFTMETQIKSHYMPMSSPVSFIKTNCKGKPLKPFPQNFLPPRPYKGGDPIYYWNQSTCEIVPHRFYHFKDIDVYDIHLSNFEVDGVYTGKEIDDNPLKINHYDKKLLRDNKARKRFKFDHLKHYDKASLSLNDDQLTIDLKSKNNIGFYIANIPIKSLYKKSKQYNVVSHFTDANRSFSNITGIYYLVGVAPRSLAYNYEQTQVTVESNNFNYSFFYDSKTNKILNHHSTDIGVEQFFVRFNDKKEIIIDLISHERIVPLARYVINIENWSDFLKYKNSL